MQTPDALARHIPTDLSRGGEVGQEGVHPALGRRGGGGDYLNDDGLMLGEGRAARPRQGHAVREHPRHRVDLCRGPRHGDVLQAGVAAVAML